LLTWEKIKISHTLSEFATMYTEWVSTEKDLQMPWIKNYIDLNTLNRQNARNKFEKDFS